MGRPLAKRFFSGGTDVTVGCTVRIGGANLESAIISQKSNSKYRVAGVGGTPLTGTDITFADANPDTMTVNGFADLTLTFSPGDSVRVASSENSGENDGVYEIATVTATVITLTSNGALVVSAAPPDTTATLALVVADGVIATLVQGTPTVNNTMQVTVTPEIVGATVEATFDISTDGAGAVNAVTLLTGGNGYFTAGNFLITDVTLTGNDDAQINFTVAGGAIVTAAVDGGTSGTGYTINQSNIAVNTADAPDPAVTAPVESAKIINARTVKTFEGNIYQWPAAGGAGTPKTRLEADLQSSDL